MVYELKKEGTIKGIGNMYYTIAPFDDASDFFKSNKLKQISARDIACARVSSGIDSSFSQNGSYVKEGVIYLHGQKKKIILVRNSPVLKKPKEATDAHCSGKEFFVPESSISEKNSYALENTDSIPTNRFAEEGFTQFLFKDKAQDYGLFLLDAGVNAMPSYFNSANHIANQGNAYANQLWLHGLKDHSGLIGCRLLSVDGSFRGVPASVSPQNRRLKTHIINLKYNKKQIDSLSRIVEGMKAGDIPASRLEKKISDFLTKIRKV